MIIDYFLRFFATTLLTPFRRFLFAAITLPPDAAFAFLFATAFCH